MSSPIIGNVQEKCTAKFSNEETQFLIQQWGRPMIQRKLLWIYRKGPVMRNLADDIRLGGCHRTPNEIQKHIRSLRSVYYRIKRGISEGTGSIHPRHFQAMDEIFTKDCEDYQDCKMKTVDTD